MLSLIEYVDPIKSELKALKQEVQDLKNEVVSLRLSISMKQDKQFHTVKPGIIDTYPQNFRTYF